MQLQKKAAYNLVQLNLEELLKEEEAGFPYHLDEWQKENFRDYSESRLFHDLVNRGIHLDRIAFEQRAKEFDTPEQMAESIAEHIDNSLVKDHAYLLIFELWRRFLPEKQTLSLACDEFDYLIKLYDMKELKEMTPMIDQLDLLRRILEENVDAGLDPKEAFAQVESHSANGIEDFLYDYILDLISEGDFEYAGDLIRGFYPYIRDPRWFDFLKARSLCLTDPEEGLEKLENVIQDDEHPANVELNLEMLAFLANSGNQPLFVELAKPTLSILQVEEDLTDFSKALLLLYAKIGNVEEKKQLLSLIEERSQIHKNTPLNPTDPDIDKLKKFLSHNLVH